MPSAALSISSRPEFAMMLLDEQFNQIVFKAGRSDIKRMKSGANYTSGGFTSPQTL